MEASATFGRVLDTVITGTTNGSYLVPAGRFAIIEAQSAYITINSYVYSNLFSDNRNHAAAFALAGETINYSFNGSGSLHYTIFVFHTLTTP